MKRFLLICVICVICGFLTPLSAQTYDFRAPATFHSAVDFKAAMTAKKITGDSGVFTNVRTDWKGLDTSDFGAYGRAGTWTGRQTFGDLVTTDSTIGGTADFTGKITGGAGAAITGDISATTRVTGTTFEGSDSVVGVTGDFSGAITGATTLDMTGASTLTGGATIGADGSLLVKCVMINDSLAFIVGTDTTFAFKGGVK